MSQPWKHERVFGLASATMMPLAIACVYGIVGLPEFRAAASWPPVWEVLQTEFIVPVPFLLATALIASALPALGRRPEERLPWSALTNRELLLIVGIAAAVAQASKWVLGRGGERALEYGFNGRASSFGTRSFLAQVQEALVLGLVPLGAAILIRVWLGSSLRSRATLLVPPMQNSTASSHASDPVEQVRTLLATDVFAHALQTSVPRDSKDAALGLTALPWLLAPVLRRKDQFRRSSQIFLTATGILGVVLLTALFSVAYALVNEEATGLGRRAARLEELTADLRAWARTVSETRTTSERLVSEIDEVLQEAAAEASRSKANPAARDAFMERVKNARDGIREHDWPRLIEGVKTLSEGESPLGGGELRTRLEILVREVNGLQGKESVAVHDLLAQLGPLSRTVEGLRLSLAAPESRIPDLIKRIAIGLLVVSFMTAVLRYCARLYEEHLRQCVVAQQDEMSIRRFYIAMKGSEGDADLRNRVLTEFMSASAGAPSRVEEGRAISPELTRSLLQEAMRILGSKAGG